MGPGIVVRLEASIVQWDQLVLDHVSLEVGLDLGVRLSGGGRCTRGVLAPGVTGSNFLRRRPPPVRGSCWGGLRALLMPGLCAGLQYPCRAKVRWSRGGVQALHGRHQAGKQHRPASTTWRAR
eukprot:6490726-Amphidinium_carterae.4